jgi:hypothetical protein
MGVNKTDERKKMRVPASNTLGWAGMVLIMVAIVVLIIGVLAWDPHRGGIGVLLICTALGLAALGAILAVVGAIRQRI